MQIEHSIAYKQVITFNVLSSYIIEKKKMKLFMEVIILCIPFSHHKLVGVALKLIDD
jgi:hypothetical protein